MSLIKCYDCSKQISDLAKACPHCGAHRRIECYECSHLISENLNNCSNCGAPKAGVKSKIFHKTKERGKKIGEWERKNNTTISFILFFIGTIWLIIALVSFDSSHLPSNISIWDDWTDDIGYYLAMFFVPFICCFVIITNFIKYSIYESENSKKNEHHKLKISNKHGFTDRKVEYNNSKDIERQYNTYNRRFKDRIYTKKMFLNKIDILNKEIEKLKRLNKIPKDYPLFEVK